MSSRFIWVPMGLFVAWSFYAHDWFVCDIKQACGQPATDATVAAVSAPPAPQALPTTDTATPAAEPAAIEPQPAATALAAEPIASQSLYFSSGGVDTGTRPDTEAALDKLASQLKMSSSSVEIIGHTDDQGSAEFNLELGLKRARHLEAQLTRRGVPAQQIRVRSEGEAAPIADNTTEEGRQKNRRVEILPATR